jgi:hypothetical protein
MPDTRAVALLNSWLVDSNEMVRQTEALRVETKAVWANHDAAIRQNQVFAIFAVSVRARMPDPAAVRP